MDNNKQNQAKKSFFRRFWWVLPIILVVVLVVSISLISQAQDNQRMHDKEIEKQAQMAKDAANQNQTYQYVEPRMTTEQLKTAEAVLANGITIEDESGVFYDFGPNSIEGDGKQDNPNPYSLGYNDLKSVTFDADEQYFYIRYDLYGVLPTKMDVVNGDDIRGIGANLDLVEFTNKDGIRDQGCWQVGLMYTEGTGTDAKESNSAARQYREIPPRLGLCDLATPTSVRDKNNEELYAISNDAGLVSGGQGCDYIIAAFPLANFGMKIGDQIIFSISVETNSGVYHHASCDLLLQVGTLKCGMNIIYTLGSNSYTTETPVY